MQTFAEAVLGEITAHGDTQIAVAARVGMSQQTVSAIVTGQRTPSLFAAARFMVVYPRLFWWFGAYLLELSAKPGAGSEP